MVNAHPKKVHAKPGVSLFTRLSSSFSAQIGLQGGQRPNYPWPCLAARLPGFPAQHPHRCGPGAKPKGNEWQAEVAGLGSASHPFQIEVSPGLF